MARARGQNDDGRRRAPLLGLATVATIATVMAVVLAARTWGPSDRAAPDDRPLRAADPAQATPSPVRAALATAAVVRIEETVAGGMEEYEVRPAPEGTERGWYAAFRTRARMDLDGFRAEVDAILTGERPLAEQVAALRAWHDAGVEPAFQPFARTLADDGSSAKLRDFAARFVAERARREDAARTTLHTFLAGAGGAARDRAQAAFALLRWSSDRELVGCSTLLHAERDPGVVERAMRALRDNPAPFAAVLLDELRRTHPNAAMQLAAADPDQEQS